MDTSPQPTTIDAYIAQYSPEFQARMNVLRETIREVVPGAGEKISWGMPTFTLHGNLVHFAANKAHIGFYPGSSGVERFLDKLAGFTTTKGGIQLPMNKPLPLDLVREIVRYRAEENLRLAEEKNKK